MIQPSDYDWQCLCFIICWYISYTIKPAEHQCENRWLSSYGLLCQSVTLVILAYSSKDTHWCNCLNKLHSIINYIFTLYNSERRLLILDHEYTETPRSLWWPDIVRKYWSRCIVCCPKTGIWKQKKHQIQQ